MIERRTIFDIHRLAHQGLSVRKIATSLGLSRQTVQKYLDDPNPKRSLITRPSKLDPFKDAIERMLEVDPKVSAMVIRQRLEEQGFEGGITILRGYLSDVRPSAQHKRAFMRFESEPGVQCQIDWGHFGQMAYGNTTRKLHYTVRNGDSLYLIAKKFRISINQLARWNNIDKNKILRPGQRLTLYVDVTAQSS